MRVYFKVLRRLREVGLSGSVSVGEVLFELSKVERVVEVKTGREYYGSIRKRSRKMIELLSNTYLWDKTAELRCINLLTMKNSVKYTKI